jgi:hypothetical protein
MATKQPITKNVVRLLESQISVVPMLVILIGTVLAENRVQSELRFAAHSKDEKTAGVWIDGQYVGFVKELAGRQETNAQLTRFRKHPLPFHHPSHHKLHFVQACFGRFR